LDGWRRPIVSGSAWLAVALLGVTAGGPAPAQPQPDNLQMDITGVGVLTAEGRQTPITAMTYATTAETKRTSFTVSLPRRALTFTGVQDAWSDKTHYTLTLDSVLSLSQEGPKDLAATGTCQMEISQDATVVRLVICQAATEGGPFSVRFQLGG
jgi:hypothetical protein